MATVPTNKPIEKASGETREARFRELVARWSADTAYLSSSSAIINHPAFRDIIAMGADVIPFVMGEIAQKPSLLVWTLPAITGVDPVSSEDRGRIGPMCEAWIRWGKEQGYQW